MSEDRSGLQRDPKDGILVWVGGMGTSYSTPDEAIKRHYAGRLVPSCNESVFHLYSASPCGKTPKFDPDKNGNPTKCGHHSKAARDRREARRYAEQNRWRRQMDAREALTKANAAVEAALRKIAAGDNDPRTLAIDTVHHLDKAREASKAANQKETK